MTSLPVWWRHVRLPWRHFRWTQSHVGRAGLDPIQTRSQTSKNTDALKPVTWYKIRPSDWSIQKILQSDWLGRIPPPYTTSFLSLEQMHHCLLAKQANLMLNKNKVELGQAEAAFRSHVISKDGLKPDTEKVYAIKNMPKPASNPEVLTLLGFINYTSRFLPKLQMC